MDNLTTYYEKKRRKEIESDRKAKALVKEILNISFELHYTIPYEIEVQFSGYVNSIDVLVHNPDNGIIEWKANYAYFKGDLTDLKLLKAIKDSLKTALAKRTLPEPLTYKKPF